MRLCTLIRGLWGRCFGGAILLCVAAEAVAGAESSAIELASTKVFLPCPRPGVRVNGSANYARAAGFDMICYSGEETRSDTSDVTYRRFSSDNGHTWSKPETISTNEKVAGGTHRRYVGSLLADPEKDALVTFYLDAVLPSDSPLEGMKHWTLRYAISRDGGRTEAFEGPVVQRGDFTPQHPLPGVWTGKNGIMIGDDTCVPIRTRGGAILQPVQICPVGPDGEYFNPGGGMTYHDSAVLIGRWNDEGLIDWRLSSLVRGDPAKSTRGMLEPTIAEMPDGRILMVLRGSNDKKPALPGYRWYAVSSDGGETWTEPRPWTYADGTSFHSPSSCSQLLRHSNGRIYWIGNISAENPRGNHPRYPLLAGEVDAKSMLLKRDTLCTIDDRRPGDPADVMISNFHAIEDRQTHEIVIYCAPMGRGSVTLGRSASRPTGRERDWTADAMEYRLRVTSTGPAADAGERPAMPQIDGTFWTVAGDPDLGPLTDPKQQPVDFAIWQAADGTWQLWSCIRHTKCGGRTRLLYGWEGRSITDTNWRPLGVRMQADEKFGETTGGLQAPYAVRIGDLYHMFYGDWVNICLQTSRDGKFFERRINRDGRTALFGEGADDNARDPMVLRVGSLWFAYYTAHPGRQGAVYLRTSADLEHWSEPLRVAFGGQSGQGSSSAECPFVVERGGWYYLLRTQRYGQSARSRVYASRNPMDFGANDDRCLVGELPIAAPEIIRDGEREYLACLLPSLKGIQVARLKWTRVESN